MKYTLITANGTVMRFYVKACAECYKINLGGVIITEDVLETETVKVVI